MVAWHLILTLPVLVTLVVSAWLTTVAAESLVADARRFPGSVLAWRDWFKSWAFVIAFACNIITALVALACIWLG